MMQETAEEWPGQSLSIRFASVSRAWGAAERRRHCCRVTAVAEKRSAFQRAEFLSDVPVQVGGLYD